MIGIAGVINGAKYVVRSSHVATITAYIADDVLGGIRLAHGRIETAFGSHTMPLEAMEQYVWQVMASYKRLGGFAHYSGTVAEIGPGDTLGVAACMRADGASEVHAIDRYMSRRDPDFAERLYRRLTSGKGWDGVFSGPPGDATLTGVRYIPGVAAETFFRSSPRRYDAIVSCAVTEHLFDPLEALESMAAALSPDGAMVHVIDLGDHGVFAGKHPMTFMTTPDWLHKRMTANSGRPNRVTYDDYHGWLSSHGRFGRLLIASLFGVHRTFEAACWEDLPAADRAKAIATVDAIRPRLATRLRDLPSKDLAFSGCTLVCRGTN